MLNKNKILIAGVVGGIALAVPNMAHSQTFYQCMPTACKDGEYFDGAKCKKNLCPAGTYNLNGECQKCPAGTYSTVVGATSSAVCKKCPMGTYSSGGFSSCDTCPDYQWPNKIEGATSCISLPYGCKTLPCTTGRDGICSDVLNRDGSILRCSETREYDDSDNTSTHLECDCDTSSYLY